jgi:hypothetical protein
VGGGGSKQQQNGDWFVHVQKWKLPKVKRLVQGAASSSEVGVELGWVPETSLDTHWRKRKLGLLGVFARIGKGGKKDLWASYVMITNIACTSIAIVITGQHLHKGETIKGENVFLAWCSMLAIVFHFVVALWLYLFTKMIRTQAGHVCRAVSAIAIGLVDGTQVVVTLAMILIFLQVSCLPGSDCQEQRTIHCDQIDQSGYDPSGHAASSKIWDPCVHRCQSECWGINASFMETDWCHDERTYTLEQPSATTIVHTFECATYQPKGSKKAVRVDIISWQQLCVVWVTAVAVGVAVQWALTIVQGLDLAKLGLRRAKLEADNIKVAEDSKFALVTDGFTASVFNTWVMALALIFLEKPFGTNLFSQNDQDSPFWQPYIFNASRRFGAAIGLVTLCKCVSTLMFVYVGVAYLNAGGGFGSLTAVNTTHRFVDTAAKSGFEQHPALVFWALALFSLQTCVSFVFTFCWTQRPKVAIAAAGMFGLCLLDLATTASTSYYALCIRVKAHWLLNCEADFGHLMLEKLSREPYPAMALVVLLLVGVRLLCQCAVFWARRNTMSKLSASERADHFRDRSPELSMLSNGSIHGLFLLVATYPIDTAVMVGGGFSPLHPRPHWTNGVVQMLVLAEKTVLVYLIIELASPTFDGSEIQHGKDVGGTTDLCCQLFVAQSVTQLANFVCTHIFRPGRGEELAFGDRVHLSDAAASAAAASTCRSCRSFVCRCCGYCCCGGKKRRRRSQSQDGMRMHSLSSTPAQSLSESLLGATGEQQPLEAERPPPKQPSEPVYEVVSVKRVVLTSAEQDHRRMATTAVPEGTKTWTVLQDRAQAPTFEYSVKEINNDESEVK